MENFQKLILAATPVLHVRSTRQPSGHLTVEEGNLRILQKSTERGEGRACLAPLLDYALVVSLRVSPAPQSKKSVLVPLLRSNPIRSILPYI